MPSIYAYQEHWRGRGRGNRDRQTDRNREGEGERRRGTNRSENHLGRMEVTLTSRSLLQWMFNLMTKLSLKGGTTINKLSTKWHMQLCCKMAFFNSEEKESAPLFSSSRYVSPHRLNVHVMDGRGLAVVVADLPSQKSFLRAHVTGVR